MNWRRALITAAWILGAAGLAWDMAAHWLAWRFAAGDWPVPPGTPWTYQLESGFIPALTVLSLLTAFLSAWHVRNCHSAGCWRLGKHQINGSPWCSRHEDEGRKAAAAGVTLTDVCDRLDKIITILESR
jgi:hypothetical protein